MQLLGVFFSMCLTSLFEGHSHLLDGCLLLGYEFYLFCQLLSQTLVLVSETQLLRELILRKHIEALKLDPKVSLRLFHTLLQPSLRFVFDLLG